METLWTSDGGTVRVVRTDPEQYLFVEIRAMQDLWVSIASLNDIEGMEEYAIAFCKAAVEVGEVINALADWHERLEYNKTERPDSM